MASAGDIGHGARGLGLDLSRPETVAASLASVTEVDHLVITAIEQGANSMRDLDIAAAVRAVTIKLVGYAETVRVLRPRFRPGGSVPNHPAIPRTPIGRLVTMAEVAGGGRVSAAKHGYQRPGPVRGRRHASDVVAARIPSRPT